MTRLFVTITQVIEELFLIIQYPLSSLIGFLYPDLIDMDKKPHIIIVIRWLNKNPLHLLWKWYLEKKGFQVAIVFFPIYKGTFGESAKKLKSYIEKYNLNDIVLVGLSSGALSCLVYLQEHDGWKRVKRFISVAGPFLGAPMAWPLSFIPSIREALPKSSFITELLQQEIKHPHRIISLCLSAKFDEMVPRWSSLLPGVKHQIVDVIGHNNLHLGNKQTYDAIIHYAS